MLRLHPSIIILNPTEVTTALLTVHPARHSTPHPHSHWSHITLRRRKSRTAAAPTSASPPARPTITLTLPLHPSPPSSPTDSILHSPASSTNDLLLNLDFTFPDLTHTFSIHEDFDTPSPVEAAEAAEAEPAQTSRPPSPMPLRTLTPRQVDGAASPAPSVAYSAASSDDGEGEGEGYYDLGYPLPHSTMRRRVEVLVDRWEGGNDRDREAVGMRGEDVEGEVVELESLKRRRQVEAARRIIR